ncbi:RHS repeat-associated protein [Dokdonella fugitiva]|uniref:RHS repeat-associated protein n=1 Tax=Dokdonella fugitiva TaxID=328517 RepID=A0A839F0W5_9GAMM|nr:RHS repeat protein [Dokdonella fugitiva]MBA8889705.1 RHS repeat-associated protein [Dokdonella fugitiva]
MKVAAVWAVVMGLSVAAVRIAYSQEPGTILCSGSVPPPAPLACPLFAGLRAECVAGESDQWHWYADTSRTNSLPCSIPPTAGTWCTKEQNAWDEVIAKYAAESTHCPNTTPTLDYLCTTYSGGVIAGLPYFFSKSYHFNFQEKTGPSTCGTFVHDGSAIASRTPHCPVGYTSSDNRGPCYRVKPEACPVNNPIQCAGGDKKQVEVDIAQSNGGLGLTRYYSSNGFYTSPGGERPREILGSRWRHSWQSSVVVEVGATDSYAFVLLTSGDYLQFHQSGSAWIGREDKPGALTELASGGVRTGWLFKASDDSIYHYDANGVWTSLEQHGLITSLSYSDASTSPAVAPKPGLLIAVTDPRNRSLAFQYDAEAYLIRVTDELGTNVEYRYTSYTAAGVSHNGGVLEYADKPGGSSRHYLYDESAHLSGSLPYNELLTGIVDENGQRFATYEYDSLGRAYHEWHGGVDADETTLHYNAGGYNGATSSTIRETALHHFERRNFQSVAGIVRDAGVDRCTDVTCAVVTGSSSRTYDGSGNPDLDTDFNGSVTDHDYNTRGLETRRVDASNASGANAATKRTTETTWNATFNVPDQRTVKNSTGTAEVQTKWSYNSRGQATARCQIDPAISGAGSYTCGSSTNAPAGVRQTKTSYCEAPDVTAGTCPLVGLVTSVNGPRLTTDAGMGGGDDITTYTYRMADDSTCASSGACLYRKGDLWKVTNALGQVTEYVSYDKNGRVKRTKDANGTLTDFTYHARGWLTDRTVRANSLGTTDPGDATLHIDYDAVGNVTKVTQPDGAYLQYTYDAAHRLIKINDNLPNSIDYCPGGVGTSNCLDAAGNRKVEQVKDPSNTVKRQLHRVYNQLGQLTQVLNAANTAVETSAGINGTGIADGYDGNGNRVYKDDGLGIRTEQDYDPLNRLKTTIQNLGGIDTATQNTTTGYTYDTRDNLRQVTDPDGLNTVYTYDGLNNLTALDSPDTGHTGYTYDAAGNRISQTDNRTPSVTSTYTYDRLNRLTAVTYPTMSLNVTYAYDQSNATTGCSTSFSFGRLTTMTDATGSTTYCYDRRGNVTKKTQVTSGTTLVTQYTYTTADRLATMTYPGGDLATYTRDVLGRITGISWTPFGLRASTLVSSAAYLPFGPLTTLTFGNGRTLTKAYDQDYAIDSISGTPAGALTLDLGVDVMGDITSASATLGLSPPDRAYGYDALYRLKTSQTGASSPLEAYTYNKTGDRLSASLNGGAASAYTYTTGTHHLASVGGVARTYDGNGNTLTGTSSGLTLTYDDRNRLASMVNGTTSATYGITGRGERVRKTVTVSGTPTTTLFGYDEGGRLTGEYSGTGTAQAEYIYLDNIPVGVFKGGALYYIETDHLGTPRQVVKPLGNVVVWKWDFLQNTFGNSAPNQDPDGDSVQFVLGMRFRGQYYDLETDLAQNYFRDFDARRGRYLQSDLIGLNGGLATYAYSGANPLRYVDAYGLQAEPGLGDQFNPGGARGPGNADYTQYFETRFPNTIAGGKLLFDERIRKKICELANGSNSPTVIPGLNSGADDIDIQPDMKRFNDQPQGWYERNVKIGAFELKTDAVNVLWDGSDLQCSKCFMYTTTMYVLENTGDNRLPGFTERPVRMANWPLSGRGCCDSK